MKEVFIWQLQVLLRILLYQGQRQVEMFADAIEASANDQTPSIKVNATFLTDPKDIAKFMQKRKKANAGSK